MHVSMASLVGPAPMKKQIQPAREEVSVPAGERTSTSRSAMGSLRLKQAGPHKDSAMSAISTAPKGSSDVPGQSTRAMGALRDLHAPASRSSGHLESH